MITVNRSGRLAGDAIQQFLSISRLTEYQQPEEDNR
jgi:hypothetical protein